jgi:hypothetical protein
MSNFFSARTRILPCEGCGAPLEAAVQGGQVACPACQTMNTVGPRDDSPLGSGAPTLDEAQRMARLRAQDGKPLMPPPSLAAFVQGGGLAPWKIQEALAAWQSTRNEVRATHNFEAADRLSFLTMLLSQHFSQQTDPLRRRALLEGALDVHALPRHRQAMRGFLSRGASVEGDLESAEAWLRPCDPYSDDLETDTAYRVSRALLDTTRRDYDGVLRTLGRNADDVPIMDAYDRLVDVFRANAVEKLGDPAGAVNLLIQSMAKGGAGGRKAIEMVPGSFPTLDLCAVSLPQASSRYGAQAGKAMAAASGGSVGKVFRIVGGLSLIGAAALAVAAVTVTASFFVGAGILFVMGLVFFMVGSKISQSVARAVRIRMTGTPGTGRVVSVRQTGIMINNVPQMAIQLQVRVGDQAPYDATVKMLLQPQSLAALQVGVELPVRVDPQDPKGVIIETV